MIVRPPSVLVRVAPLLGLSLAAAAQSAQWLQRPATLPQPPMGVSMAYDDARRETVLFLHGLRQTWVHAGADWVLRASTQGTALSGGRACYDSVRQRVVLVAGNQSTGNETWEWNGSAWSPQQTGGLQGRQAFALAFDATRSVMLLFGGNDGSRYGFADLWAWAGTSWRQIYNGGPTPRWSTDMVHDAQHGTVLLFGGRGSLQGSSDRPFGDTWEWNGSYWVNHFGLAGPAARNDHRLVHDPGRSRTVLFGGTTGQSVFHDTWEWDGAAWQSITTAAYPPELPFGMVFDSSRGVAVLVSATSPVETWEYLAAPTVAASYTPFGAGCAGPNGTPDLAAVAGSLPRLGTTLQLQLTNLPTGLFNLAFGVVGFDASTWGGQPLPVSLASIGMPACQAWIAPAFNETLANVAGTANWTIAIPMNRSFLGADLYLQGGVLAPGWNAAGAIVSNAGHLRVGVP